ncbi:hypothetical protein MBLNU457_g0998t1 [Dothideomycetes sp. NU457]
MELMMKFYQEMPKHLMFKEEDVFDYRPRGLHPVVLGDTLKDGRYTIRQKLGFGGFSTVWAARDNQDNQWVAVKIIAADRAGRSRELATHRALAGYSRETIEGVPIIQLLDEFLHNGPNGQHQCIVLELLGPSVDLVLADLREDGGLLATQEILTISRRLLQAVGFLHSVGYAHGDVSLRNIAYTSTYLGHAAEDELFEQLGQPETEDLIRNDGEALGSNLPAQLVKSTNWNEFPDDRDADDVDVRLIDLGEAFAHDAIPEELAQPPELRAPEVVFTGKFDYRLYNLVLGYLPMHWSSPEVLAGLMIDFTGELPPEWTARWEHFKQNPTQDLAWVKFDSEPRLERVFNDHVHDEVEKRFLPIIRGLTRMRPEDRISAAEALRMLGPRISKKAIPEPARTQKIEDLNQASLGPEDSRVAEFDTGTNERIDESNQANVDAEINGNTDVSKRPALETETIDRAKESDQAGLEPGTTESAKDSKQAEFEPEAYENDDNPEGVKLQSETNDMTMDSKQPELEPEAHQSTEKQVDIRPPGIDDMTDKSKPAESEPETMESVNS